MEERQHSDNQSNPPAQFKRIPITIPSHAEVQQQSRPQPPPSLFQSSSKLPEIQDSPDTFTQAFSFVKKTKSYSPPPAAPPPSTSNEGTQTSSVITSNSTAGQASKPDVAALQCRNSILVNRRQQGNPVLKHIKNIRWVFSDIVPDYILGQNSCALYLSLRYHLLHPDYIYFRIRELMKSFRLRVILCFVDVEDVVKPLHEVTKTALLHDCTLLCAWSLEECARYLETIKIYENKPADNIQERTDNDYLSRLTSALTTIRHVNKTNVVTLGSTFGSLAGIMGASMEELARCPDIGERKVKRLYDAFHEPFRRKIKQARLPNMGFVNKTPDSMEPSKDQQNVVEDPKPSSPKASVRRALDIAYEKHGEKLNSLRSAPSTVEENKTQKSPGECEAKDK